MTEIIAHRGASFLAPENTLAAVRLGWDEGADAVEVDVRMTADRRIVAIHDADLLRISGVERRVDALRLAELDAIDVGRWKGKRFAGERVPTLAALLATIPPGGRFFAEIKCGEEIVYELANVVRSSPFPEAVVPIGFSLSLMRAVKDALPICKVYGVFEFEEEQPNSGTLVATATHQRRPEGEADAPLPRDHRLAAEALIGAAREYRLDGVDLDAKGPITGEMVNALKAAGLDVCVWTVDQAARARELIAAGVQGITTNRPAWMRRELGESAVATRLRPAGP